MKSWLLFTLLLRIPLFVAIDLLFVHDWRTSASFCAVFTLLHLVTTYEDIKARRKMIMVDTLEFSRRNPR